MNTSAFCEWKKVGLEKKEEKKEGRKLKGGRRVRPSGHKSHNSPKFTLFSPHLRHYTVHQKVHNKA